MDWQNFIQILYLHIPLVLKVLLNVACRAGEPELEPGVFGSLEPEPVPLQKNQETEPEPQKYATPVPAPKEDKKPEEIVHLLLFFW